MDNAEGRYAYVNPSVDQLKEVDEILLDRGVVCRVDTLPGQRRRPETSTDIYEDEMKTSRSSATSPGEEGVRFLVGDDEDEKPVPVRSLWRYSREDSLPSSPPPYIANFDQLFEAFGNKFPLPPRYSGTEQDQDLYSDESPDTPSSEHALFYRQNSAHHRLCQSSLRELVHESWENTTNFLSFHRRIGTILNDKYCMRFKIHSTIFMFMHVVYGATLLVMATFAWNRERGVDSMSGAYLITNGVLSVFLFPILFMEWSTRVGGCLEERNRPTKGYYFAASLFLRICLCITGAVCVYFRYPVYLGPEAVPDFEIHQDQFLVLMTSVFIDWGILFLAVIVPCSCCGCWYLLAGTVCCKPSGKIPSSDKTWITEKT